jgi:hypothetical protein
MKSAIGLSVICFISIGIFVLAKNSSPIDIVRNYFELSKKQQIEEASLLWSDVVPKSDAPKTVTKNGVEKFRFEISYSEDIYNYDYEILNYKEFPKSEDSTVVCLSLNAKKDRKLVFRVELSLVNHIWKINSMKDAREDALAVINKDCMPDGINLLEF